MILLTGGKTFASAPNCMKSNLFSQAVFILTVTAATLFGGDFDFSRVAGPFLNAANQFVFLAFNELQIVAKDLRKFLFQFAFGDVPISLDDLSAHNLFSSLVAWKSAITKSTLASGVPLQIEAQFFIATLKDFAFRSIHNFYFTRFNALQTAIPAQIQVQVAFI